MTTECQSSGVENSNVIETEDTATGRCSGFCPVLVTQRYDQVFAFLRCMDQAQWYKQITHTFKSYGSQADCVFAPSQIIWTD